jgi:hypothetical protein
MARSSSAVEGYRRENVKVERIREKKIKLQLTL